MTVPPGAPLPGALAPTAIWIAVSADGYFAGVAAWGVALLALAGVAALFCFLRLADLIASLIVIRIVLQFLVQSIGVIVLRIRRPDCRIPHRQRLPGDRSGRVERNDHHVPGSVPRAALAGRRHANAESGPNL